MIALIAAMLFLSSPVEARRPLLDAIRQVESGGDAKAVGDSGSSKGPMQIGRLYWQDATEYGKVDWSYDDLVWSRPHCEQIVAWYWARYGAETDEQRARMHVAGPDGPWQDCSLDYWQKVKAVLDGG